MYWLCVRICVGLFVLYAGSVATFFFFFVASMPVWKWFVEAVTVHTHVMLLPLWNTEWPLQKSCKRASPCQSDLTHMLKEEVVWAVFSEFEFAEPGWWGGERSRACPALVIFHYHCEHKDVFVLVVWYFSIPYVTLCKSLNVQSSI